MVVASLAMLNSAVLNSADRVELGGIATLQKNRMTLIYLRLIYSSFSENT